MPPAQPLPTVCRPALAGAAVLLPLLLGSAIYARYRPAVFGTLFSPAAKVSVPPAPWVLHGLPDFCLALSLCTALLWLGTAAGKRGFVATTGPLWIVLGAEAVQHWMPGSFTFDPLDLLASALAYGLALPIHYKLCRPKSTPS